MAQLAIKGHVTRSKEVIEILEMLGGTNSESCWGVFENRLYTINAFGIIEDKSSRDNSNYQVYTLEEFLEKFPYKIGDNVIHSDYESPLEIVGMKWEDDSIKYEVYTNDYGYWFSVDELQPYKEETMEEIKIDIPKGYEFAGIDDDNQQVVFERIVCQYPKTHEECCDVLGFSYMQLGVVGYACEKLGYLQRLLLCRDAYWKIAGEQMGLGKPWEPDWRNIDEDKYCIEYSYGRINSVTTNIYNYILAFPTAEMRDAFCENFRELIEECKELL